MDMMHISHRRLVILMILDDCRGCRASLNTEVVKWTLPDIRDALCLQFGEGIQSIPP